MTVEYSKQFQMQILPAIDQNHQKKWTELILSVNCSSYFPFLWFLQTIVVDKDIVNTKQNMIPIQDKQQVFCSRL